MENKRLTIADALPLAEHHIAAVINQSERLRKYEFGPVHYWRETEPYWVFSAGSQQLQDEGYVPGAVFACVDKVDGHIWSTKEQERYAQSLSAVPLPPKPVNAAGKEMLDIEDLRDSARRALAEIIRTTPEWRGRDFNAGRLTGWGDAYVKFSAEEEGGDGSVSVYLDPFYGHVLSAAEVARAEQTSSMSQIESQVESHAEPLAA